MLRKERQPGVPAIEEYLKQTLKKGETLGFDGRCIMQDSAEKLITQLNAQGVAVRTDIDLTGAVWKNRPELSAQPVWPLPVEYAGESSESKLSVYGNSCRKESRLFLTYFIRRYCMAS